MNSRHPSPRRVWKVGSGARLLTPLPRDPGDPVENSETFIFEHPSITLSHLACKAPPRNGSRTLWRPRGPLGRLWELLEELWEGLGDLLESFGEPLGELWEALGEPLENFGRLIYCLYV